MQKFFFPLLMGTLILAGCSQAVSSSLLRMADQDLSFAQLMRHPQAHRGKVVVLGGVVVLADERENGTLLTIEQTGMGNSRPGNLEASAGRFLAFDDGSSAPSRFVHGTKVTVAGRVEGEEQRYPYLVVLEIHRWEERPEARFDPTPEEPLNFRDGYGRRMPRLFPERNYPFNP
ncbi:Outer membrane lipoprotein Slp family protein [Desulfonatronum thiosulfatophilum]|uniref:Outer membrane lipoprotein Slp family protein n=1 Tax=Desulfonatronum thiosulfatophilum TaxID=617002 RepID=A0A1G6AVD1_9BACT|nr:Slp family lipoprotein [Desulfonatronum thiosulfatophilum]SDB12325.1 Outer membrane lipoprotein Slp family protein [Desulfonatronum thiosulfatophilum]